MTIWHTALSLGRVSNLPTVWSNVLAGVVLAGVTPNGKLLSLLVLALSLIYVAGMFLNDAFDRHIDAIERPERPIPAGEISAPAVFVSGFVMLGGGVLLLTSMGKAALLSGAVLAALVVFYNCYHKANPFSPLVMGLCRMLTYITSAVAATGGTLPSSVLVASLVLLSYLIGLTYIAKHEGTGRVVRLLPLAGLAAPALAACTLLPHSQLMAVALVAFAAWTFHCLQMVLSTKRRNLRKAVVGFIAGIALNDALLMSQQGTTAWVLLAGVLFFLTLLFQRRIAGT